jgi:hypothetical protein
MAALFFSIFKTVIVADCHRANNPPPSSFLVSREK